VFDRVTIRSAVPADVEAGTHLLYLTMGRLADYLLGSGKRSQAEAVLSDLFVRKANRFSYQFAYVAEIDEDVAGLLLSYPATVMESLKLPTARQLVAVCGLPGAFRFLRRSLPLVGVKEAEGGEYFVSNLAVLPGSEGQGVGSHLLAWAHQKARMLGINRCSLIVEVGNSRAHSLYEHLGYRTVQTVELPQLQRHMGFRGYRRMVKELP